MRHMPALATFLVLTSLSQIGLSAESFVQCNVLDPEFHNELNMMVYETVVPTGPTGSIQKAHLVRVSSTTGLPVAGTFGEFATDVAPYGLSQAGPKFANGENPPGSGQKERFLAYSAVRSGNYVASIRKHVPGAQGCSQSNTAATTCFPDVQQSKGDIPNTDDGEERWTVYTSEEEYLTYRAQAVYHADTDSTVAWSGPGNNSGLNEWIGGGGNAGTETSYVRAAAQGPIGWARMEELKGTGGSKSLQIVTTFIPNLLGNVPLSQIYLIDAVSGNETLILPQGENLSRKFNPFLFQDATTGANMIVARAQVSGTQSNIVIYKQQALGSTTWDAFLTIEPADLCVPGGACEDAALRTWLLSPEPFDYDDDGPGGPNAPATYILFSSANDQEIANQTDGNVWVARVKSTVSAVRVNERDVDPVSGDDELHTRVEAEVFFPVSNGAPVFFYQRGVTTDGEHGCELRATYLANQSLFSETGVALPN